MNSTTMLPLPVIPPEILTFAEEEGVTAYLPAVLAMTRRIFPTRPITVIVTEDPEIANDRHIVFEVEMTGKEEVDELFTTREQWIAEIFEHCPSTRVCVFRLGMVAMKVDERNVLGNVTWHP
jgi:hypothetical protein